MPCKGAEPGLARNIEAAVTQQYENYETIIVVDKADDPAYSTANSVLRTCKPVNAKVCIAEPSPGCSGKVSALLTALNQSGPQTGVYAFLDSDAFVPPRWLRDIVDPLNDESIGATTGFRWYLPTEGGFWSHVESAWNAAGTNLLFEPKYNFPWGGAMALRSETLGKIRVREVWREAVSDDMTLNSALRAHGYRIVFLPQCMVATFNKTTRPRFLTWATRQTALTRVFNYRLWRYALVAYSIFDLTLLLAMVSAFLGILLNPSWFAPAALLLAPTVMGVPRSIQRSSTFRRAMPELEPEFRRTRLADAVGSFIVPWIMTYCIIKSARNHEIEWRGRKYTLTGTKSLAPP
jgi:ceramide glucosyltransferase